MREQARSGMSVAAFCRERQLCAPQFFQWKKRLAEAGPPARGRFIPVEITARAEPRMALEVVLGNGRVLRVAPGFDREHLAALIAALEGGR